MTGRSTSPVHSAEDELIVRGNGAVQVVGGVLLALGRVP
jgi:hypothetical protein